MPGTAAQTRTGERQVEQGTTGQQSPHTILDREILRNERISVGSGDENVAKIQLAARWAEQFAPEAGDSLDAALTRFRRAYTYIDSVSKLVDPEGV